MWLEQHIGIHAAAFKKWLPTHNIPAGPRKDLDPKSVLFTEIDHSMCQSSQVKGGRGGHGFARLTDSPVLRRTMPYVLSGITMVVSPHFLAMRGEEY